MATYLRIALALVAVFRVQAFVAPVASPVGRSLAHTSSSTLWPQVDNRIGTSTTSLAAYTRLQERLQARLGKEREVFEVDLSLAKVESVNSIEEFQALKQANPNKLLVLKHFIPYCRACKAVEPKFARLSITRPDVVFVNVDISVARDMKQALDIRAVPSITMHMGELVVENFTCGPSKFSAVVEKVGQYSDVAAWMMKMPAGLADKFGALSAGVTSMSNAMNEVGENLNMMAAAAQPSRGENNLQMS